MILNMKVCTKCGTAKPEDRFSKKGAGKASQCKECFKAYMKLHYSSNKQMYAEKRNRNRNEQRERLRALVANLKSDPCTDCGGKFHHCAMDFDHVRGEKILEIGIMVKRPVSESQLIEELAKCELVCSNCHRVRTWNRSHA